MIATIALCAVSVFSTLAPQSERVSLETVVPPDAVMQSRLKEVVNTLTKGSSKVDSFLAVEKLSKDVRTTQEEFVRQALLFLDDPSNGETRIVAMLLVDRLEISPSTRVLAIIPYLDDERTRNHKEVQRLLLGIEGMRFDARPDFSSYQSLLEGMKDKFPRSLSEHMFRRSAGGALLIYLRNDIQEPKELRKVLWAEHVVDDYAWKLQNGFLEKGAKDPEVTTQLQLLAGREEGWARRYVVEILHAYPQLDDGMMLEALKADPNKQVSTAANESQPARR